MALHYLGRDRTSFVAMSTSSATPGGLFLQSGDEDDSTSCYRLFARVPPPAEPTWWQQYTLGRMNEEPPEGLRDRVFALAQQELGQFLTVLDTGEDVGVLTVTSNPGNVGLFIMLGDYADLVQQQGPSANVKVYEAWRQQWGDKTLLRLSMNGSMTNIVASVIVPHVPLQIPGKGKNDPPQFKMLLLATVQQYGFGCGTELPAARSCQCNGKSDGRGSYSGGSFDAC